MEPWRPTTQVGGQYLNLGREQYLVRGWAGDRRRRHRQHRDHEREGSPIYVRDVAEVKEAPGLRFGAVTRNGRKSCWASRCRASTKTPRTSSTPSRPSSSHRAGAAQGRELKPVYDRTEIVDKALKTSESALIEGSILVAVSCSCSSAKSARPSS
jgi:cobalt-zinc-cadmium resistance protein CzcA